MRVGIINGFNSQKVASSKNQVSFQGPKVIGQREFMVDLYKTIDKKDKNPAKLTRLLKQALRVLEGSSAYAKMAKFEFEYGKKIPLLNKKMRSTNIKLQKSAIDEVIKLHNIEHQLGTEVVGKHIFQSVIQHIKKTNNRELADYFLTKTYKDIHHSSASTLSDRMGYLEQLGDKKSLSELNGYKGEQRGISEYVKRECPRQVHAVGIRAASLINKLGQQAEIDKIHTVVDIGKKQVK